MFENRLSYVEAYKKLVDRLAEDGIFVLDKSQGWALPNNFSGVWIFIASNLGRRRRLYALAHEAGHLYTFPRYGKIKRTSTKLRSESRANEFALRVCRELLKVDVAPYYKQFKKSLRERKSFLWRKYGGQELREANK